jgi:hypothetical protein
LKERDHAKGFDIRVEVNIKMDPRRIGLEVMYWFLAQDNYQ